MEENKTDVKQKALFGLNRELETQPQMFLVTTWWLDVNVVLPMRDQRSQLMPP